MRHAITLSLCLVLLFSCKKETIEETSSPYEQQVKRELQDSLPAAYFSLLDDARATRYTIDSDALFFYKVPLKESRPEERFVLVQTTESGKIIQGSIVDLKKTAVSDKPFEFRGRVTIYALKGTLIFTSVIERGYIQALHPHVPVTALLQPKSKSSPDVIIIGSYTADGNPTYTDWMNLKSFSGDTGSGATSGWYTTISGFDGGGGSILQSTALPVDMERGTEKPAINIEKYLKCFDAISDAGAICSIEIFVDIPIDKEPNTLLNWQTGSPGHTFITIRKRNGTQSVSQNIGFYPKSGWKTIISNAPIDGKFVDNDGHEYNAGLKMDLTPEKFKSTLTEIQYLASFIRYDIDEYNCTDFALDVFNKTRSEKLEIPLFQIPGGMAANGTRTPQGLYNRLKQMKDTRHPEASNITMNIVKGWAGHSTGACN